MKLTDTHLVLLSRATQRDDGALDVPATLKDRQKIIGQLLTGKLVEEVAARGALPVWRRDEQAGQLALIVTDAGLKAIRAEAADPNIRATAAGTKPKGPDCRSMVASAHDSAARNCRARRALIHRRSANSLGGASQAHRRHR